MGDKTPATTTQQQSSTSTTDPWSAATPLLQGLINSYGGLSTSPTANQTTATNNLVNSANNLPDFTGQAGAAVNSTFGNAGMLNSSYGQLQGNLGATASGANLNPYSTPGFSDAINTATSDITNATKGVYAGSGRDPSGAGSFSQSLGRGLTQGIAPIIQSQYNTNEQNMLNANNTLYNAGLSTVGGLDANTAAALGGAGALPTIGTGNANAQLNAANTQQSLPYADLLQQLQAAGMLGGMGGTTNSNTSGTGTQTPANDPLSNWIGGISAGAGLLGAFAKSDARAKEDIKSVGKTHDGQNIYSYRMKGSPTPQIGMLAQEVEKHSPESVREIGGVKHVNYATATRKAAQMGMLRAA